MSPESTDRSYRVLARKYRPTGFSGLIGQAALVRTLTNAIQGGRLAHAYLLTGVRGVGKTTTARILARALNCVGPDGGGGPTATPCGECEPCRAIAEDRHVDVLEMDAASRTKVEEMREVLDGVHYRPVSARYKVYIIDEVHMLSRHAFNALLKTLEEPPPHVTFIFATTEVRKVPMTVLSRCQRFDLRRVDAELLLRHLGDIAGKEAVTASEGALALIARAADGSVRDALSMLDQAISHCQGEIDEASVRDMLGLADRAQVFDLFEAVMAGEVKAAFDELARQYEAGVDPLVVVQDLLELTHWLTRVKLAPGAAKSITVAELERRRGTELAERLSLAELTRAWQMLLKGLEETRTAPEPLAAVEMVLVRLAYVADLPTPGELVKAIRDGGGAAEAARSSAP
ncbi:MAG: DNA polymerase III subunit gamma/tau, partial [Proteobacteria bacterium]|nr:DNA polymerase III subunit gamma/tau [Pseudomonadota bacterium]